MGDSAPGQEPQGRRIRGSTCHQPGVWVSLLRGQTAGGTQKSDGTWQSLCSGVGVGFSYMQGVWEVVKRRVGVRGSHVSELLCSRSGSVRTASGTRWQDAAVLQVRSTGLSTPGHREPTPHGLCPQLSGGLKCPHSRQRLFALVSVRSILRHGVASTWHIPVFDHTAPSAAKEKTLGVSAAQRGFPREF